MVRRRNERTRTISFKLQNLKEYDYGKLGTVLLIHFFRNSHCNAILLKREVAQLGATRGAIPRLATKTYKSLFEMMEKLETLFERGDCHAPLFALLITP